MFNAITIKSKDTNAGQRLDIGFLAESLLFYKTVNLIADKFTLPELFRFCGIDGVRELIKIGRLNLYIKESHIGVSLFPDGDKNIFGVTALSSESGNQEKTLSECFLFLGLANDISIKLTNEFLTLTKPFKYSSNIASEIIADLQDSTYLKKAIALSINFNNPATNITPEQIEVQVSSAGQSVFFESYNLETNLDFSKYTNVSANGIILNIAETRGNINIAGHFNSEIADKYFYSLLIQEKFNTLFESLEKSQLNIKQFQEVIISDFKSIASALQSNEITFKQFISILEKADKFRSWLSNVDQDKDVIKEYLRATEAASLLENLPIKVLRFAFFTGSGIIAGSMYPGVLGTVIGGAISVGDAFLLDKLFKGWKPNQFVNELKTNLPKKIN